MTDRQVDLTKPRHRRRERGRALSFALLAVVLLGALGGGVFAAQDRIHLFGAADYDGPGTGSVPVRIADGSTLAQMGDVLVAAGVVRSTPAFTEAAQASPRGTSIQSGTFTMRRQMSAEAAVALLLDPRSRTRNGITVPEGKTARQVYAILAKASGVPVADFEKAGRNPAALGVPALWLKRDDGRKPATSIEGFLFPDTYEFKDGATAAQMLTEMVRHFLTVAEKIDFVNRIREDRRVPPYDVLTVASLAQAEAGVAADYGKIARVAYNRIYGDFPCHCLEFDVGINYYYQLTGRPVLPSRKMTDKELYDPRNPYRLHGKAGLTPTPIDNPGEAALIGAMSPPAGSWLFFVAIDKQGHSAFSTTVEGHENNKKLARRNGVL